MEQWQTTLIGSLGGFAAGLILEPIKFHLAVKFRRTRLRNDIYDHIGRVRYALLRYASATGEGAVSATEPLFHPKAFLCDVSTDLFDSAVENDKADLYSLPESSAFKLLYEKIRLIRAALEEQEESKARALAEAFESDLVRFAEERFLNPARLREGTRVHRRRLAARANSYYRS